MGVRGVAVGVDVAVLVAVTRPVCGLVVVVVLVLVLEVIVLAGDSCWCGGGRESLGVGWESVRVEGWG